MAAGVGPNGSVIQSQVRYNIASGNSAGPGVPQEQIDDLIEAAPRVNGQIEFADTGNYLERLDDAYTGLGNPLDEEVAGAIGRYIDEDLGGTFPIGGGDDFAFAARFPGSHAEIQAVNDLVRQGVLPENISVGTTRIANNGDFEACLHCSGILNQLRISPVTG